MKMFTTLKHSWLIIFLLAFTQPVWAQNARKTATSESAANDVRMKAEIAAQSGLQQAQSTTVSTPSIIRDANQKIIVQGQSTDQKNSSALDANVRNQTKPGSGKNIGTPVPVQVSYGGISKPLSELAKEPVDPKPVPSLQTKQVTVGDVATFSTSGSSENSFTSKSAETERVIPSDTTSNVVTGPTVSWNGMNNINYLVPALVTGAVSPTHYVQTQPENYQIFNRSGTSLLGPVTTTSLFSGTGWNVQPQYSIPIYDKIADRWIFVVNSIVLTSTPSAATYVAVSTTSDVMGTYHRYQFSPPNLWHYPGVGLWPDGLYLTYNVYPAYGSMQSMAVMAINRSDMISGVASPRNTSVTIPLPCTGCGYVVPSNLEGTMLPPTGTKNLLFQMASTERGFSQDGVKVYEFSPDFTTPANSVVTDLGILAMSPFDGTTPPTDADIEQAGTTRMLDAVPDKINAFRVPYRNLGTAASPVNSYVVAFPVKVSGPGFSAATYTAGIKWGELRRTGITGLPTLRQEGTWAPNLTANPATAMNNWLPGINQNKSGDILLAYTSSSSTTFPTIKATGRMYSDPLGTMTQGETVVAAGGGSQTASERWGEYMTTSVDPVNDCDFWVTGEYYATTSPANWISKIAGGLNFTGTTCLAPTSCNSIPIEPITVSGIAATSATIGWTALSPAPTGGYDYYFSTASSTPTAATMPSGNTAASSVILSGLAPSTLYYVWVRVNCGSGNYGNWMPLPTFTTCAPSFTENFDDIANLTAGGWSMQNNSSPIGITNWFQGNTGVLSAYNGATSAYIGADFNNIAGTGTISNWLISPSRTIQNGDVVSFYTTTTGTSVKPDRLQVRLSTNGTSTNVGTTATSVGDFSILLLDINPAYTATGYPSAWTRYTATISGLPIPVTGRIAFRYFVENGGPGGTNSNYIGIDAYQYSGGCVTCAALPGTLAASAITTSGATITWTGASPTPSGGYDYYISTINTAPTTVTVPTGNTPGTSVNFTGLTSVTTYYVWVRSNCGGSSSVSLWVPLPSFTTTPCLAPMAMPSTPNPAFVNIPDGGYNGTLASMASRSITVSGLPVSGPLPPLKLKVNINHAYIGDLVMKLVAPDGKVLALMSRPGLVDVGDNGAGCCGSTMDFINANTITFEDAATQPSEDIELYAVSGVVQSCSVSPSNGSIASPPAYTSFAGLVAAVGVANLNGTWTLYVGDASSVGAGSFAMEQLIFERPCADCEQPTALSISSITGTTATLSWTAPVTPISGGYEYYISTTNTPPTAATPVTGTTMGTSVVLSGLTYGTTYYVWVRSNCGGSNGVSLWAPLPSFTATACNVLSAMPSIPNPAFVNIPDDGYNGTLTSMASRSITVSGLPVSGPLPHLKLKVKLNHAYIGDITMKLVAPDGKVLALMSRPGLADVGDNGAGCCGSGMDFISANTITFEDAATQPSEDIAFYAVSGVVQSCSVRPSNGSIASPPAYTSFVDLVAAVGVANLNGTWKLYVGDAGSGDAGSFGMEQLIFELPCATTCEPPTALSISSITGTTATLSWTAPATPPSGGYDYFVGTTNTAPTSATTPTGNTAGTSVNLTGLTAGTTYYVWVRSNCGAEQSSWVALPTFVTLPSCVLTCPSNISVNAAAGSCSAVVNFTVGSTGTCGTITSVPTSGSTFPMGTTTVNVTDGVSNCSFTVTVTDNQNPTITCPANLTANTATGVCTASVVTPNPATGDNCGVTTLTWAMSGATTGSSPATGINNVGTQTFNSGVTTITYTVTDAAVNSASCSFTVTVTDNQNPTITCPANMTANTAAGVCTASVVTPDPATGDNCGVTAQTWAMTGATTGASPATGINNVGTQTFNNGLTTVTYTVTDAVGNTATCSFTVTVTNSQNPTVTCPANMTANTAAGACTASVVTPNPTTGDNCGVTTLTWAMTGATTGSSPATGINNVGTQTFNSGVTTVNYTVTGAAGNSASCSFTVTVTDNVLPTITCPANITANTSASACTASVVTPNPATGDNCGITTLTWAMTGATTGTSPATGINNLGTQTFNGGITTVTYTAQDATGNTATCSFTVTVTDNVLPTITCPANITANTSASACTASVVTPNPATGDNCGVTTLTWAMTGATTGSSPATGINNVGTQTFNSGVTTVTYTVTDAAGNTANCSFTVTVTDNQNPTITCPANLTANTAAGVCTASVVTPNPATGDNCGVTTLTWAMSGATTGSSPATGINNVGTQTFNSGVTTVTYTVTDANGNMATCSFTVTVTDNQNPTVTCPSNMTANTAAGVCTASVVTPNPTTGDNCGVTTLTWAMTGATTGSSPAIGINNVGTQTFNRGVTTIIYTVKDAAGNAATCTFTVTVTDNQNPSITCPGNLTGNAATGTCGLSFATANPTTADNCGVTVQTWAMTGATVATSPATGINNVGTYTFNVGVTTVTYTVRDTQGNTATCSFTVTVNDTQPPTITCPANIVQGNDPNLCSAVVTYNLPSASDNCNKLQAPKTILPHGSGAITVAGNNAPGGYYFNLTNNSASPKTITGFSVRFGSTTAGGVAVPSPAPVSVWITTTASTYVGNQTNQAAWTNVGNNIPVTLAGANAEFSQFSLPSGFTLAPGQTKGVFMFGTASSLVYNNGANSNATPITNGVLTLTPGEARNTAFGGSGLSPRIPNVIINYITLNQTAGLSSGSVFPVGTTTNTFQASDDAGNTSTCSFTVKVEDRQAPTITCPANINVSTPVGSCTAIVNYTATATDNCPGSLVEIVSGPASGSVFPVGITTIVLRAKDAAGNLSPQCSFTVTVNDAQLPVVTTQPLGVKLCDGATATFTATATNALSYQWQVMSGGNWVNVSGATSSTLTINPVTASMNGNIYRLQVKGLCSAVYSNEVILKVDALPTVILSASSQNMGLVPGETTTVVAVGTPVGGTYEWLFNGNPIPGAPNIGTFTHAGVNYIGAFNAIYTDQNGCKGKSATDLIIRGRESSNLFVYPNPNSGQFDVRYYNVTNEAATVMIYNAAGQIIYKKAFTTGAQYSQMRVNMGTIAAGVYEVRVIAASGKLLGATKVVIKR